MSAERWLPIVGFEGLYEVSDLGRVRSIARTITKRSRWGGNCEQPVLERVLKPTPVEGYPRVNLYRDGAVQKVFVHHAVAAAFIGPRPAEKHVLHGDGVKLNCTLVNLRYGTPAENIADAFLHNVVPVGERAYNAKFSDREAAAIKGCRGLSRRLSGALAAHFGVRRTYIHHLWAGLTWKHVEPLPLDEALQVLGAVQIPAHHVADFCRALADAYLAGRPGRAVVTSFAAAALAGRVQPTEPRSA